MDVSEKGIQFGWILVYRMKAVLPDAGNLHQPVVSVIRHWDA
jgi:hypothetical protein